MNQHDRFPTDSLRRGAGMPDITSRCDATVFTDAQADAIRQSQDAFPFSFNRSPFVYSLNVSFPIFNNFQRENAAANANLARADARFNARQQELRVVADVTNAYEDLATQYQAVQLLEQMREFSREALALAQERYRIGSGSYLELSSARNTYEQASLDVVTGIYEFHRFLAVLENAVGRRLR